MQNIETVPIRDSFRVVAITGYRILRRDRLRRVLSAPLWQPVTLTALDFSQFSRVTVRVTRENWEKSYRRVHDMYVCVAVGLVGGGGSPPPGS